MNYIWQMNQAFLGAGGNNPNVEVFNADSGEGNKLLELPPLHSVYTIDTDSESGALAAGTKGGLIYLTTVARELESNDSALPRKLVQGASVLSVCWINKALLASSDTAGRCFLWNTIKEGDPRLLKAMKGVTCSLLSLPDGLLAGLSIKGKLSILKLSEGRVIQEVDFLMPPPMHSLVRMVYWPSEHAIVFPTIEGKLALCNLSNYGIRYIEAHKGEFYAITVWGDNLVSVGKDENSLKIWSAETKIPVSVFQVPSGVISAALAGSWPSKILLVDVQGMATSYVIDKENLQTLNHMTSQNYRVVSTLAQEKVEIIYNQWRESEVLRLLGEIKENAGKIPDDVIDKMHSQLIELGYEHVSLAIRAENAEQREDIVGALKLYSLLIQIIPLDNPKSCPSVEKYAILLAKAWLMKEAEAMCKIIMRINPEYPFVIETKKLSQTAILLRESQCIIEPDIPIDHIIESATIVNKQFGGRYMINKRDPDSCCGLKITSKMIQQKYEQIRMKSRETHLPEANIEQVWWLSRGKIEKIDLIGFGKGQTNGIKGLQFALQVLNGELETVVIPVIIFDTRKISSGVSIKEKNENLSSILDQIINKALSNPYLASVHMALNKAIRRLVTKGSPVRRIK